MTLFGAKRNQEKTGGGPVILTTVFIDGLEEWFFECLNIHKHKCRTSLFKKT